MLILIHFPNIPLYQHFFLQPAPQCLTGTPPLLSHCCPGAPLRPCPHLCAQTLGQCHQVSVAPGTSLLLSISAQPGPRDTLIWGAPSPWDSGGKGAQLCAPARPVGQDCPEGSALSARPTVHLPPAPLRPRSPPGAQRGPHGDSGSTDRHPPRPDPAGCGALRVPLQPLARG